MRRPDIESGLFTDSFLLNCSSETWILLEREERIHTPGQAWQTQIYSEIIDAVSVLSDCVDTVFGDRIAHSVLLVPRGVEKQARLDGWSIHRVVKSEWKSVTR